MEEISAAVFQGNLAEAVYIFQTKPLEHFHNVLLNIAIVGEPGSGKSSFINAILGLSPDDPGAAQTGIHSTRTEIEDYVHPTLPHVILCDLPGKGAASLGGDASSKNMDLKRYDFFIIVGSQRFRSVHVDLVHEIQQMGKEFFFVRSKVDLDLEASKRQRPSSYSEDGVISSIREDCRQCLMKEGVIDPKVFVVSNWDRDRYDFLILQETLKDQLLKLKKKAFGLNLPEACSPTLDKKESAVKKKIWTPRKKAVAAIPIPFLPLMCLFAKLHSWCHLEFGLDDRSLGELSQCTGKKVSALKAVMKPWTITTMLSWSLSGFLGVSMMVGEYYWREHPPVFTCLLSGGISFLTARHVLQKCISDSAKDTKRVLAKALESEDRKSI